MPSFSTSSAITKKRSTTPVKSSNNCQTKVTMQDVACELSNIGVHLIREGDLEESLSTLRSAVSMMRLAFHQAGPPDEAADKVLSEARTKISKMGDATLYSPLSVYSQNFLVLNKQHAHSMGGEFFTPVLINTQTENRDIDLESAVILHNFAFVHILLSSKIPQAAADLTYAAAKVSLLSYRVAEHKISEAETESDQMEPVLMAASETQVVLLKLLLHILEKVGDDYSFAIYSEKLHRAQRRAQVFNITRTPAFAAAA